MKKTNESDQRGKYDGDMESLGGTHLMNQLEPEPLVLDLGKVKGVTSGGHYRAGEVGRVSENEQDDARDKDMVQKQFAMQVHKIITSSLQNKKITGKIVGHNDIVSTVTELIKLEIEYLKNLFSGKSADDPQLKKLKSTIEVKSSQLKRNTDLEWPFK